MKSKVEILRARVPSSEEASQQARQDIDSRLKKKEKEIPAKKRHVKRSAYTCRGGHSIRKKSWGNRVSTCMRVRGDITTSNFFFFFFFFLLGKRKNSNYIKVAIGMLFLLRTSFRMSFWRWLCSWRVLLSSCKLAWVPASYVLCNSCRFTSFPEGADTSREKRENNIQISEFLYVVLQKDSSARIRHIFPNGAEWFSGFLWFHEDPQHFLERGIILSER